MVKNLEKPSFKQLLVPVICLLFLLSMSLYLVKQPLDAALLSRKGLYVTAMTCISALMILGSIYCFLRKARLVSYLCTVCLLLGLGCTYQFFFAGYQKYVTLLLLAVLLGIATYAIYRRINTLSDLQFWLCAGAVVVLIGANLLFGISGNGAKLWLDLGVFMLQPGEVVKVLLILIGASSFRNTTRSVVYCVLNLFSCGVLLVLRDLGGAVVLFALFVVMTYLLFDNRLLSVGIIIGAFAALVVAVKYLPHAAARFSATWQAMDNPDSNQQRKFLIGILMGGFRGLGAEDYTIFTSCFSADSDGALAGVLAVLGFPVAVITMGTYASVIRQAAVNRSVYTSSFLIHTQLGTYVFAHALLNFAGATDLLPFTGLVAPFLSSGGSAALCFGMLLGLGAAALDPVLKPYSCQ